MIGAPLLALWLLWLARRLAVLGAFGLPPLGVATVDVAFGVALTALAALMAAANALSHVEALDASASGGFGARLGIAAVIAMILLIGGRITPSFTRNWLAQRKSPFVPAPPDRFDAAALGLGGLALVGFVLAPEARATGALCLLAGALYAARLARWAGWRTREELLLLVLHVGYAFVPIGFVLSGGAALLPQAVPQVAALHGWTAGAAGVMTLAVMMRASLGHSGRALTATPVMSVALAACAVGAMLRLAPVFMPASAALLHLSVAMWVASFGAFLVVFAPILARPRA